MKFAVLKMFFVSLVTLFFFLPSANADQLDFSETFFRGQVLSVLSENEVEVDYIEGNSFVQELRVLVLNGELEDQVIDTSYISPRINNKPFQFKKGNQLVLVKTQLGDEERFEVYEPYRINALFWLMIGFVALSVFIAGKRGVTALLGLSATLVVLIGWMSPAIISGQNPFIVSVAGVILMAGLSFYLSHGFNLRTSIALVSTMFTLVITAALAYVSVVYARLFGLGSGEAASLGFSVTTDHLDLRGLLLGAIVIGALGVLDDVTTSQVATIQELKRANSKLKFIDLYKKSMVVGRAHITSLINTLVIAYVGASLPVFLLFTQSSQPFWVILNNEFLSEEIVRTLVGSSSLILSVPIASFLAAYVYSHHPKWIDKNIVVDACCHH